MKRFLTLPAWFAIASVWFGMHAGGGYASGQQEVRYFLVFGWTAILMPFIAEGIQGIVNFYAWDYSRVTKSYDYRTWVTRFYHPFDKIFANIMDAVFIIFLCLPTGAAIAGAASLMVAEFGLNYMLSTFLACGVLFFCTIFGSELVRRASAGMTFVLLVTLFIIVAYGISATSDHSSRIIAERVTAPEFSWLGALKLALLYASFQACVGPLISVAEPLKTRADVLKTTLTGVLLNGGSLALICWMLLGAYPEVLSDEIPLPVLHIINKLDLPVMKACYSVVLFFAFISTGVAFVFASVRRFEKCTLWKVCRSDGLFGRSLQARAILISILTMLYALAVSQFGLVAIVSKGYSYMGWAQLLFVVIPVIVFGAWKCRRASAGLEGWQKNQESPHNDAPPANASSSVAGEAQ